MWYVYIRINFPDQEYVGATADQKQRIPNHNAGRSAHTSKFKPWELVWYCGLPGQVQSAGLREISQIALRPRLHEKAPLAATLPASPPPPRSACRAAVPLPSSAPRAPPPNIAKPRESTAAGCAPCPSAPRPAASAPRSPAARLPSTASA